MYLTLVRDLATESYSMGLLKLSDTLTLQTLELPWIADATGKGGREQVSCVPVGVYELIQHDSPKHPKSFALLNPLLDVYPEPSDVPAAKSLYARSTILLHVANFTDELKGCIALGNERRNGYLAYSAAAMAQFNALVPWAPGHSLEIIDAEQL